MYSLMNHELIHVVQSDIASERGPALAAVLPRQGPGPVRSTPNRSLYSYLTTPRFTTPRWWAEGGAVFFETWMGGGLGRAQGGYDEMVFRAMVRDDAHFYDPLGLASRGVFVDFQTGRNAYLYGTRFIHVARVRLFARRRSSTGTGATRKANATTRTSSSACSAFRSIRPGRTGSSSSTSSSGRISPRCESFRSRRTATCRVRRRDPCRGRSTTRPPASSMAAFATRAWLSTSAP